MCVSCASRRVHRNLEGARRYATDWENKLVHFMWKDTVRNRSSHSMFAIQTGQQRSVVGMARLCTLFRGSRRTKLTGPPSSPLRIKTTKKTFSLHLHTENGLKRVTNINYPIRKITLAGSERWKFSTKTVFLLSGQGIGVISKKSHFREKYNLKRSANPVRNSQKPRRSEYRIRFGGVKMCAFTLTDAKNYMSTDHKLLKRNYVKMFYTVKFLVFLNTFLKPYRTLRNIELTLICEVQPWVVR
jgi:hypothetical protein